MASTEVTLASALGDLHRVAGKPTSRKIAAAVGPISHTTVADALAGRRVPSWPILEKIVRYLEGDVEAFRALWAAAAAPSGEVPDESASAAFARQYRRQAAVLHEHLVSLPGGLTRRTEFDRGYLPQHLRRVHAQRGEPSSPTHFAELAAPGRRSVVLAAPGSGKTTLCVALLRWVINASDGRLPFLIRLRELAAESPPNRSIVDHIEHQLRSTYQLTVPQNVVRALLVQGRAVVLFDGLDELVQVSRRADVVAIVELFAKSFPASTVVVTSRVIGYQEAAVDSELFQAYRIEEFDDDDVGHFVRQWFRTADDDSTRLAAGFLAESAFVFDLRRNPLLLSLMCSLYTVSGQLPRNLAEVYEKCSELLFERWDRMRGIPGVMRASTARSALAHIAYFLLENSSENYKLTSRQVVQILTDYFTSRASDRDQAEDLAREFLAWCTGRAWVFTSVGTTGVEEVYGFTHRAFLDYFAALGLVRRMADPRELAAVLTPRVAAGEWPMAGQIAVQLIDRYVDDGASKLVAAMLDVGDRMQAAPRGRIIAFVESCAEIVAFAPPLLRDLASRRSSGMGPSDVAGRLCIAVDIVDYSRRPTVAAYDLQKGLTTVLEHAVRNAGMAWDAVLPVSSGDGLFLVLPPGNDDGHTLRRLIAALRSALADRNRHREDDDRLRLRVAFTHGPVDLAANGVVGFAVIEAHRMVDAAPLREHFRQDPSVELAVAMSEEVHAVLEEPGPSERVVIHVKGDRPSLSFWVQSG